ncbi:PE-PPE domain-containing protein [Mycolicibacterium litorale]|uniref:PE-PPE domain-containing protein n=1 Tax=Mycolicibacterium litorale TaxID=758802 RepID=A0AAD1MQF3_9MYCO|nr:PE-PPE domain-containing protein [Mycolicibacterium litorale]MCV7413866.1 PE-PPE domain-containing protein [Mycolicibacterium litorale]TDY03250.1 PE-PPE domain-containing protein [Mycolicibacterium litorale]BBY15044.1 hypothetical protein MLIT_06360 [Mycolicibacterium litorale]
MRITRKSLAMTAAVPLGAMALTFASAGPLPLPVLPVPTELLAQGLYLRGTKIGGYTEFDAPFVQFANGVIDQTYNADNPDDTVTLSVDTDQIEYNGGFRPFSQGGFNDLTYGQSVEQGVNRLGDGVAAQRAADPAGTILVYGYSQGAVVAGQYKARTDEGDIVYVLLANPGRPNGGILARFQGFTIPILDIPLSGPTPTVSEGWEEGDAPTSYDLTRQYDGWADFPKYPLNVLATINAVLGIAYLHGNYEVDIDPGEALADEAETDTHVYRDTVYYTIGTGLLPLLRPLEQIGVPRPLLLALDAPLRVIVEQGYDRGTNPGAPGAASLIRLANPATDLVNLLTAVAVGIDDGLEAGGFGRPLHTTSAGMYGVGGPTVTPPGDLDLDLDTAEQGDADDDADADASIAAQESKARAPLQDDDLDELDGDTDEEQEQDSSSGRKLTTLTADDELLEPDGGDDVVTDPPADPQDDAEGQDDGPADEQESDTNADTDADTDTDGGYVGKHRADDGPTQGAAA